MGVLRVILALCVVVSHGGSLPFLTPFDGNRAVALFFMISGFYMTLALTRVYGFSKPGIQNFFSARFFRIFPIYILGVVTAFIIGEQNWSRMMGVEDQATIIVALLANFVIIGGEMLSFFTVEPDGSLAFLSGTLGDGNANWLLVLPQGWSIGVELMFYAVCPFILWSARLTFALFVASLALRIGLADAGDLWQTRFFPSALCLFLAGALAYQFGEFIKPHERLHKMQGVVAGLALPIFVFVVLFSGSDKIVARLPLGGKEVYLLILPVLYALFEWTKSSRFDRQIGQLSYPIFVFHWVVVLFLHHFPDIGQDVRGFAITGMTILVSIFVTLYIETPIDTFRHRRYRNARPVEA